VSHHRRTHFTLVLVAALAMMAAVAVACSAPASGGSPAGAAASGTSSSSGATGGAGTGSSAGASEDSGAATARAGTDDWGRIAAALAWMQAEPPTQPVVVLLGGSSARESTISDKSWRRQIVAKGGSQTLAWNMGSHNRTMAQNLAIVKALPKGAKAVVIIGVNLGSFTSTQKTATIKLPSPAPSVAPSLQQPHQYSTKTGVLSTAKKKAAVREWLVKRYPVYKANFAGNAGILAAIIEYCKKNGYTPVLLELPRDSAVIGTALNSPTAKFRNKCKALAAKYSIRWVPLMATLPNRDFYDLWHLVEPGRTVWQAKLSAKTAALLK
jgi:lysophospholipase L1-like esterase